MNMQSIMKLTAALLAFSLIMCSRGEAQQNPKAPAIESPTPASTQIPNKVTTVARGLDHPWGLEFLPDGRMLVTERPGRLRIVMADGRLSAPVTGVPQVYARGQGGLLDVALDP